MIMFAVTNIGQKCYTIKFKLILCKYAFHFMPTILSNQYTFFTIIRIPIEIRSFRQTKKPTGVFQNKRHEHKSMSENL